MRNLHALPLLLAAGSAVAADRHVPAAYATIQQAVDAAVDGDTVIVAPGTYHERLDVGGKRIAVRSSAGATQTVIDADGAGTVVRIGQGATRETIVEGFTLTDGLHGDDAGGLHVEGGRPTIRANIIVANRGGSDGNGISARAAGPLIVGNRIADNHNSGLSNGGGGGGGIGIIGSACFGQPTPPDCMPEIYANLVEDNSVEMFVSGGGIALAGNRFRVIGNVIRNNRARLEGGGIALSNGGTDIVIENNLFVGNRATHGEDGRGGGLHLHVVAELQAAPFVINNTFVDNVARTGSAVYSDGFDVATRLINNLIVGVPNVSAVYCGMHNDAFPPIVRSNNVVVSGAPAYAGRCAGAEGTLGNIASMPVFAGPGDFRLAGGSADIDAGNNAFSTQATDLSGHPRIVDGDGQGSATVDIGAYEFDDALFADSFDE